MMAPMLPSCWPIAGPLLRTLHAQPLITHPPLPAPLITPCPPPATPPLLSSRRALLAVAERNGNHLHESWQDVLCCVSRFELLQQATAGVPTDALLFAMPERESPAGGLKRRLLRPGSKAAAASSGGGGEAAAAAGAATSITDMGLHAVPGAGGAGGGLPPPGVLASVDVQELNRLFVLSGQLDSEAVVEFVQTLCMVATEELRPVHSPRVFSLAKIVEIAHFNMGRIRWGGLCVGWVAAETGREGLAVGHSHAPGTCCTCCHPLSPVLFFLEPGLGPHLGGAGRLLCGGGLSRQPQRGHVRGGLLAPAGHEVPGKGRALQLHLPGRWRGEVGA